MSSVCACVQVDGGFSIGRILSKMTSNFPAYIKAKKFLHTTFLNPVINIGSQNDANQTLTFQCSMKAPQQHRLCNFLFKGTTLLHYMSCHQGHGEAGGSWGKPIPAHFKKEAGVHSGQVANLSQA